jgi:hypothetical protein
VGAVGADAELFPKVKPGGRPRTVARYAIVNAILDALCSLLYMASLTRGFSCLVNCFWRWSKDATWLKIHDKLYQWVRVDIAILNDFLYISVLMNFGEIKFMFLGAGGVTKRSRI